MAGKKITITDIARLAGVSATTVSHIINRNDKKYRIATQTREAVLKVMQQYSDRIEVNGWLSKANSTRTIGVIVPDMSNYSFSIFLHHLEAALRQKGLQLLIACSHYHADYEKEIVHHLLSHNIDALITVSSHSDETFYRRINMTTPVLLFDRYFIDGQLPYITSESRFAVSQLIQQKAQQVNEFYFLAGDLHLSTTQERLLGFKEGLTRANLLLKEEWIVYDNYRENLGYELLSQIHQRMGRLPQAIFTASSNLLEGVISYLVKHKVNPQHINLCSYDYNLYLSYLTYQIDFIAQDYQALTSACSKTIEQLISRKPLPHKGQFIVPKHLTLPLIELHK